MAIKRSSTKWYKFTSEVLRAKQASCKIYPRQSQPKLRPVAGVCNVTKKNIDGIPIKPTQKSATASETINAFVKWCRDFVSCK